MQAIAELSKQLAEMSKKLDEHDKGFEAIDKRLDAVGAQLEAIRQGIVDNNIRFDRLEGNFHHLRADVTTMIEEVRHNRRVLV